MCISILRQNTTTYCSLTPKANCSTAENNIKRGAHSSSNSAVINYIVSATEF